MKAPTGKALAVAGNVSRVAISQKVGFPKPPIPTVNLASLVTILEWRRPFYFDGRFLSGDDLTRDQDYFGIRFADLGRAVGGGVIAGLSVAATSPTALVVGRGTGVTPSGGLIVLQADLTIDLADGVRSDELDAAFGASGAKDPAREQSGAFVLALRAAQFTANPVGAFPSAIDDRRMPEDGDFVEAVAATLLPFGADHVDPDPMRERAALARAVFVDPPAGGGGAALDALPVAVVYVVDGVIQWVDEHMARREVGADGGAAAGDRAVAEAYVRQYDAHLAAVLADRAGQPRFAAATMFQSLPAVGRLPAAAVDHVGKRQVFFPAAVNAALAVVPEDEVGALVEESLLLPPIDLTADAPAGGADVLVLDVRPRAEMRSLGPVPVTPLASAAPLLLPRLSILDLLGRFATSAPIPVVGPAAADGAPPLLWYVRRRGLKSAPSAAPRQLSSERSDG